VAIPGQYFQVREVEAVVAGGVPWERRRRRSSMRVVIIDIIWENCSVKSGGGAGDAVEAGPCWWGPAVCDEEAAVAAAA
jgi:hypothetical protein